MIQDYLKKRMNLMCTFVLIDANVPPQKIDLDFVNWLGEMHLPFVLVYTKVDKLKPVEIEPNIKRFQDAMLEAWEELPQQFISSANSGKGRQEILEFIETTQKDYLPYE